MNDFGHAIGAVPQSVSSQLYGQQPHPQHDPYLQAEVDNLAHAHAQARLLAEGGDLTAARTLIEEALAGGELRLGLADQRLAPLMVDLATIARRLGNLTEARNQLRRAYGIIVAATGPEDATSLSIEGRLAAVAFRLGEPTEAYDWHLADAGRRVLGTDHPAVRGAENRLAASAQPTTASYAPVAHGVYQRQADIEVVPPPPLPAQDVEVWPEPPLENGEVTVRQRRSHGGGLAVVASIAVVILVAGILVAMQLLRPGGGPTAPDPVSRPTTITVTANPLPTAATAAAAKAPTRVLLKDDGGSVTLNWDDPSAGKVPFIVSVAREGHALRAMASVPAGQTTSTIHGLNIDYDYCFTVSAVWSADSIQPSIRTCTFRLSTSGS